MGSQSLRQRGSCPADPAEPVPAKTIVAGHHPAAEGRPFSQTERTDQDAVAAEEDPKLLGPTPGTEGPSRKQRKEPVNLELIVGLPQVDEEAAPLVKAPTDVLVDVAELLLG